MLEEGLKIECVESAGAYGRYVIEPLERGEGLTLGNALRRVLLSSLPGAAVTWIRIEGIQHEFTAIPYVKEDATEFMLNVKTLRLRPLAGQPGKLALEASGEGEVTAADIKPSPDFEVVNPELHLATLDSAEARLSIEFNVELGKGFVPAKPHNGQPIGIIPVDAIFTPVYRVNYSIQPTHTGHETSYERLILEVWTDGTISAVEAISRSAEILVNRLSLFVDLTRTTKITAEKKALRASVSPEKYDMPLEQLGFSVRTFNCLKRGGMNTLGDLLEKSEEELLALRHFGEKARQEVREKLLAMGVELLPSVAKRAKAEASLETGRHVELAEETQLETGQPVELAMGQEGSGA